MENPRAYCYYGTTGSPIPEEAMYGGGDVTPNKGYLVGRRYIGDRTSRRKSDFLFSEKFSLLVQLDHSRSSSIWKQNARDVITTVRRYQQRSMAQKGPEKHANRSPVKNISVYGLMIISRRRRRKEVTNYRQESIPAECHIPESTAVNTGDREKSEKRIFSIVHVTKNLQSCVIELIALKCTAVFGTHSRRKTRMKTEPPM